MRQILTKLIWLRRSSGPQTAGESSNSVWDNPLWQRLLAWGRAAFCSQELWHQLPRSAGSLHKWTFSCPMNFILSLHPNYVFIVIQEHKGISLKMKNKWKNIPHGMEWKNKFHMPLKLANILTELFQLVKKPCFLPSVFCESVCMLLFLWSAFRFLPIIFCHHFSGRQKTGFFQYDVNKLDSHFMSWVKRGLVCVFSLIICQWQWITVWKEKH